MKLLILSVLTVIAAFSENAEAACGYQACPATKANMINVHLAPHSHDDVGWLKTVDQYYYGSRTGIQRAGVQYILDNVVTELLKDSNRRFIYVESAFFKKWWDEQTPARQKDVQKLVKNGQLEIAGGAWSMNDEAAVHYQSVVDQFTHGLKWVSDNLGSCGRPTVGWQIDPFGHSREMASLFAQMGFDGEFFARTDWVEKSVRMTNKTAEMIWKASESLGESAEIFTSILANHYSAPPGFCFDALCSDDPIIDGSSPDNNVKERVDTFISYIKNMTTRYRSKHLLVPMGDDFNYENADMNYKNMDKLIRYVNERQKAGSNINIFYSSPACYLNSVHNELQTWPNKTQDFFPYSTDWHTYWTGYYTSRPTQKRFERDGNHFLQVAKQLVTFSNLTGTDVDGNLDALRSAMGVMQHHDAITGTEKQRVAYDYDRLLNDAFASAHLSTRQALQKLTNLTTGEFVSCLQLNISVCEFTRTEANNVVVTLFNPLSTSALQHVRVPVKNGNYVVVDAYGRAVSSQLIPVPAEVIALSFRDKSTTHELVFAAYVDKIASYYIRRTGKAVNDEIEIVPLEERLRHIARSHSHHKGGHESYESRDARAETTIKTSNITLTFDSNNHLKTVQMNGITENIRQDFFYYRGALGNNGEFKNRSSGAYIFRPNGTEIQIASKVSLKIYEGPLVKEVHQHFNDWVSQVVRIYEGGNRVEFEWLVGPIPIGDNIGKEVITRFTSSVANNGVFYTDSNGREMMKRVKNQREYFKPNLTEEVSGNYYPITARIAIQDAKKRIALLNDRAQGGSSLKNGAMELMLHRRLLHDDAFGVGEALNETAFGKGLVARGKVYLILSPAGSASTSSERFAQREIHLPFWKFFSNASRATNRKVPQLYNFYSLPGVVNVLTLEPYSKNERLLRLEHFMDKTESSNVTFNIREIFDALGGQEISEKTLDGSMPLKDMKRFKFHPDGTTPKKVEYYTSKHTPLSAKGSDSYAKFSITMDPMQIRTFIIKWK